jgi:hypothetical protein
VSATFIEGHFRAWAGCLVEEGCEGIAAHLEQLYETGSETLFNLDTLRDKQLLSTLQNHTAFSGDNPWYSRILPRLFMAYVKAIRRHRSTIFGGSSGGLTNKDFELRGAALAFFGASKHILFMRDTEGDAGALWVLSDLLEILEKENIYRMSEDFAQILPGTVQWVVKGLVASTGLNGE